MTLRLEVRHDWSGIAALREEWNAVCARSASPSPALTFEWFEAWWTAFARESPPEVATVRDGERLLAVAPLLCERQRSSGLRWRVTRSPTNAHSPVGGFVLGERMDDCIEALLAYLGQDAPRWDLLQLDYMVQGESLRRLRAHLDAAGWPHVVETKRVGPVLDLGGKFEDFLDSRGSTFRQSVRRKVRKAQAAGASVTIHRDAGDVDGVLARCFAVSEASWSGRAGTSIASASELRAFYRGLVCAAGREGWLCLAFLQVDGRDVAFELSLDYAGGRHNLKMAYDERYTALSPGVVLRYHVLEDAFSRGLRAFYFLGDRAEHKDHWASRWEEHCRLSVFAPRPMPLVRYAIHGPLRAYARKVPALRRLKDWMNGARGAPPHIARVPVASAQTEVTAC